MKRRKNLIASLLVSVTLHGIAVMCIAGFVIAGASQLVPVFKQGASSIVVTLAEPEKPDVPAPVVRPEVNRVVQMPVVVERMLMPAIDMKEQPIPAVERLNHPKPLVQDKPEVVKAPPQENPSSTAIAESESSGPQPGDSAAKNGDNASKGVQALVDEGSILDIQHPTYPLGAKLRGEEGLVVVKASVNAKGRAEKVEVLKSSGYAALDESAVNAMKRAKFVAKNGGVIRVGEVTQPFLYKLVIEGTN